VRIAEGVHVDEGELSESFVRSPGPGGQNVNKVATAVRLRFDLARNRSLPEEVKERLRRLAGSRVTLDGVLVIEAHRFRTRERNREDARERLARLVQRALVPPVPRRPTRPTGASKLRRLDEKRMRGERKASRGDVPEE
jgi:ribosome-associated protein